METVLRTRRPADALGAEELSRAFEGEGPQALLEWAIERFAPRIALSTAFQAGGVALLDMAYRIDPGIRVVSVDTGRLPQETHELVERLRDRYPGLGLTLLSPGADDVERMVAEHGPNLFQRQASLRRRCCHVRKVLPLGRYLASLDAWITGLRRDQGATRASVGKVEIDRRHGGIVKLNPLADWSEAEVWEYVRANGVPAHPLYDRGYTSIGCAPCTRPVTAGESSRAGRWWWEEGEAKECGLHCTLAERAPWR